MTAFMAMSSAGLLAQDGILKGRVIDKEGNPVAGAVVNVMEGSRIALSDADGYFRLKKVGNNDEIYASCVGYLPTTKAVEFDGNFVIVLEEDTDIYQHESPVPFGKKPMKYITSGDCIAECFHFYIDGS